MKPKFHFISSGILFIIILAFGFTHKTSSGTKNMINWSERTLVWEDFELVRYLEEDFVATILSDIHCPDLITDKNSKVYAFMNPNLSERLRNEYDSYNVLTHEQYHFNITEYCARLLRKEIVDIGLGGLSYKSMKSLKEKYAKKLESLQNVYDSITEHNSETKMQRYWELKIDDFLRQTSYYQNEDIYSYHDFTKNRTDFFKKIYLTFSNEILPSYPVDKKDIEFGETYEILYNGHRDKTVKFYRRGKLSNGGYFNTAITKIQEKEKGVFELHYYNSDETYNTDLDFCIQKSIDDGNKNMKVQYFNKERTRVNKNSINETRWKHNPKENSYYSSYFDNNGRKTVKEKGIYHAKRVLDKKERTILFENYNRHNRLINDKDYTARYEWEFNDNNDKIRYRIYDEIERPAFHLNDYHLAYDYDERGNMVRATSLDEDGEKIYDKNGASIYEYNYDLHDRVIDEKRFNKDHLPVIPNDDYFQKVIEYDNLGRISFEGYYYPEFVLKYNEDLMGASRYYYEGDSIIIKQNIDVYNDLIENNYKVAIVKKHLNKKNELIKEIYLDVNKNFAKTENGIVEYRYKFDEKSNQIESTAYDSIGKPKEFEEDVAIVRREYDQRGNKTKTTYYNTDNKLAIAADSITYNLYKYSNANKLIEQTNFDINMRPGQIDGVHKTRYYQNNKGRDSIMLQYDVNNKLVKGVCLTKYHYNKYGNETKIAYFDAARKKG